MQIEFFRLARNPDRHIIFVCNYANKLQGGTTSEHLNVEFLSVDDMEGRGEERRGV